MTADRYRLDGLAGDLTAGRSILYLGQQQVHAREVMRRLEKHLPADAVLRVRWANGREEISGTAGGLIRFRSVASRGVVEEAGRCEVVAIDEYSAHEPANRDLIQGLLRLRRSVGIDLVYA